MKEWWETNVSTIDDDPAFVDKTAAGVSAI